MKTIQKHYVLFFFFAFYFSSLHAQEIENPDFVESQLATSPTVSAFQKYNLVNVNLYTGTPNIGIPIYQVRHKDLSVPISLTYHSSGMKVQELASWVGMGWSLQAGGLISRTVVDLPDDAYKVLRNNGQEDAPYFQAGYLYDSGFSTTLYNKHASSYSEEEKEALEKRKKDTAPDVFHFNFGGYSERFVFDGNGKAKVYSEEDLKIEYETTTATIEPFAPYLNSGYPIHGAITEFRVTTPKGVIYVFNVPEASVTYNQFEYGVESTDCNPALYNPYEPQGQNYSGDIAYTAWYLSKIISPNSEDFAVIDFSYRDEIIADHNITFQQRKLYGEESGGFPSNSGFPKANPKTSSSLTITVQKRLTGIQWEYGAVDFVAEENRKDIYHYSDLIPDSLSARALSTIAIKGSEGGNLRSFDFTYGAFAKTNIPCANAAPDWIQTHRERLKLESITESNGGVILPPYIFTYEETALPPRHSAEQDYWGYYNGNGATDLLSQVYAYPEGDQTYYRSMYSVYPRQNYSGQEHLIPGNDRSPNEVLMQAGVLKNIKYPAGGSTSLEYEANQFQFNESKLAYGNAPFMGGGLRIKKITDHDGLNPAIDVIKEYDYTYANNGESSGKLVDNKWFAEVGKSNYTASGPFIPNNNVNNYSLLTSGRTCNSGSQIIYAEVAIKYLGNGKTINQYIVPATYSEGVVQDGPSNGEFMFELPTYESGGVTQHYEYDGSLCVDNPNYGWNRGQLFAQLHYDENANLVERTSFLYQVRNYEKIVGLKAHISPYSSNSTGQTTAYFLHVGKYYHLSVFKYLSSKWTESFLPNGTLRVEYDYSYGPNHTLPLEMIMENSDGKEHKTVTEFPLDISGLSGDAVAANNRMQSANMIHYPIRVKRYVDENLIGGREYFYKNFDGTSNYLVLPHLLNEIYSDGSTRNIITRDYHPDGNIKTSKQLGQAEENYTWDQDLLQEKQVINWHWQYDYNDNSRLLKSITDLNNIKSTFEYDDLSRLSESTGRNGGIVTTYGYDYTLAKEGKENRISSYNSATKQWTYQYFDGLGRDLQSVKKQYSPDHRDVVNEVHYDNFGRAHLQYLPYEGGAAGEYYSPYGPKTTFTFEASPLSKELIRRFADNTQVSTSYSCNSGGEVAGGYPACSLFKEIITDENGHPTEIFTDKIGQLILTRRYVDGSSRVDTYNEYDDRGNLVGVLPPETTNPSDPAAYEYEYNNYNLVTSKKIPGAGIQAFTYYPDDKLQTSADANGTLLTFTYDVYGRQLTTNGPDGTLISNVYDAGGGASKGKLTNEYVATLGGGNGTLQTSYFYDNIGRVYQVNQQNHQGGADGTLNHYYGATDIVESNTKIHNGFIKIRERYKYDHSFRLKETWHKINHDPWVILSDQGYNHRDELIGKSIGGEHNQFLQSIGYGYNVRGWLTNINYVPLDNGPRIEFNGACSTDSVTTTLSTECGLDISLEQLLDLRMTENINLDCYDPCHSFTPTPPNVELCDFELIYTPRRLEVDSIISSQGIIPLPGYPYITNQSYGSEALDAIAIDLYQWMTQNGYKVDSISSSLFNRTGVLTIHRTDLQFDTAYFHYLSPLPSWYTAHPFAAFNCGNQENTCTLEGVEVCTYTATHGIYSPDGIVAVVAENVSIPLPNYPYQPQVSIDPSGAPQYSYLTFDADLKDWLQANNHCVERVETVHRQDGRLQSIVYGSSLSFDVLRMQYQNPPPQGDKFYEIPYTPSFCSDSDADPFDFPICDFTQTIHPAGMAEAQNFANYFGDGPYRNLLLQTQLYGYSFYEDGQSWPIYPQEDKAEAEWDLGLLINDPENVQVTSYQAKVDLEAVVSEFWLALSLNGELLQLNTGAYFIQPGNPGIHTLIPMNLPNGEEVQNIQMAVLAGSAISGDPTPGADYTAIDGVWVEMEYKKPCDISCFTPEPECSPAEYIAQAASLETIQTLMEQMATDGYSSLSFPVNLTRVVLCGGDIIYLFDHEIALLEGSYFTDQVITITSSSQVFNIRSQGEATGGGGNSGENGIAIPDLFGMEFHYYDSNPIILAEGQNNGNIAWVKWQIKGRDAQYYGYRYDELDRLKRATFGEDWKDQGLTRTDKYTVDSPQGDNIGGQFGTIQYDKRGNIKHLLRNGGFGGCIAELGYGWQMVDQLDYTYNGSNQLTRLYDGEQQYGGVRFNDSGDIAYDANGNLIKYPGKNISQIDYNYLNLPNKITFSSSNGNKLDEIEWAYDAKGNKQVKKVNGAIVKEYLPSGVEYDGDKIEAIYTSEGRAVPMYNPVITDLIDSFRYEFVIRDHLGNGRIYFSDLNEDSKIQVGGVGSEIMQENHYYPFGLNHEGPFYPQQPVVNGYQYNGKELNEEFGLNWNDYGARFYDPAIGRWSHIDPLAEVYHSFSPYNYTLNNPVRFIDPNGMNVDEGNERDLDQNKTESKMHGTDSPDDWVLVNGQYRFDKSVTNQEQAETTFGGNAKYAGRELVYTSYGGRDVQLNTDGSWNYHNGGLTTQAYTNSIAVSGALGGGIGLELGKAYDNFGNSAWFFRVSGELGFGGGIDVFSQQQLTPIDNPIFINSISGNDVEHNIGIGPVGAIYGGDQSEPRPSNMNVFTDYGNNFTIGGGSVDSGIKNFKLKPKLSLELTSSFGKTYLFSKSIKN